MNKFLIGLLILSVGLNAYLIKFPKIKKETVIVPGAKESTIVYKLPDGNQSATVKIINDYKRELQNSKRLVERVKGIPDLENEKKLASIIEAKMKLELNLSEKELAINDKEKQIKEWKDKFNRINVNNETNVVSVVSEVSPKIATTSKRDGFLKPKETYTTITSENPSVKFYGVESYQFKNPKQKDFLELNLKLQGLYVDETLTPYGGAELLFNPDGKFKPILGYGYFYKENKLVPYFLGGMQYNLIRF